MNRGSASRPRMATGSCGTERAETQAHDEQGDEIMTRNEHVYVVGDRVRYRGSSAGTQQRAGDRIGVVIALTTRPEGASRLSAATARVAWGTKVDDWNYVLLTELVRADSDG